MARITEFEILNHGWCNAGYFQGCGVAFTRFENVVTGAGDDAVEAYHDAVAQVLDTGVHFGAHVKGILPKRPRGYGVTRRNRVPAANRGEGSECYYYVSIRWNESEG